MNIIVPVVAPDPAARVEPTPTLSIPISDADIANSQL